MKIILDEQSDEISQLLKLYLGHTPAENERNAAQNNLYGFAKALIKAKLESTKQARRKVA